MSVLVMGTIMGYEQLHGEEVYFWLTVSVGSHAIYLSWLDSRQNSMVEHPCGRQDRLMAAKKQREKRSGGQEYTLPGHPRDPPLLARCPLCETSGGHFTSKP